MLLISVMLGGLVLSATAIAGTLMYFTLQQSSDAISSAAAFFAADAGVEQGLYCYFYTLQSNDLTPCQNQPVTLSNGATGTSTVTYDASTGLITATGIGHAGHTERILQTTINTQ
jgi:hypothetical protein